MNREDCKPGLKVRVIANTIKTLKPDSVEPLQKDDVVELHSRDGKNVEFGEFFGRTCVLYCRYDKMHHWIYLEDIEPIDSISPPAICNCNLWTTGCICGVFAKEREAKL